MVSIGVASWLSLVFLIRIYTENLNAAGNLVSIIQMFNSFYVEIFAAKFHWMRSNECCCNKRENTFCVAHNNNARKQCSSFYELHGSWNTYKVNLIYHVFSDKKVSIEILCNCKSLIHMKNGGRQKANQNVLIWANFLCFM